ncbi:GPI ethanolamine phosphate transferase 1 [Drosophila busckii]|uniref:GPI ethanolamine phosphate transferase 1 n=1 Tax=Drosophila busckii TaxID=30019 RepID=UPI001432A21C|nr:GPI ethanolamine phosphate transferase 1 [Drosophila busckii]
MWLIYALLFHLLLLGAIYVIYFQNTVLEGLQPQPPIHVQPPADRLVFIVTDGLRAESFFSKNCNYVPHLREIFLKQGVVGVLRIGEPTESRPGHIALTAGLYAPVLHERLGIFNNFDTVFNHSARFYAWGVDYILQIFQQHNKHNAAMYFDAYEPAIGDDTPTTIFDSWVFGRVQKFLQLKQLKLRKLKRLVFFLHLMSLDEAGHVYEPNSKKFLLNLQLTEKGIWNIYQQFEAAFPDKRTAYVMCSDHGMKDSGSHGDGTAHELEVPFMLWGAGIAHGVAANKSFVADNAGTEWPQPELQQLQLTPLMSALLGLPTPVNNLGMLPHGYLNTSEQFEALAAQGNAMQLLAQYEKLLAQQQRGALAAYMPQFKWLTQANVEQFKQRQAALSYEQSAALMQLTQNGINYYQIYYNKPLLLGTTLAFLGWLHYVHGLLLVKPASCKLVTLRNAIIMLATVLAISFAIAQQLPLSVAFYALLLPLLLWLLASQQQALATSFNVNMLLQLLLTVCCLELLVLSFYKRRALPICFLIFTITSNCLNILGNLCHIAALTWLLILFALSMWPVPAEFDFEQAQHYVYLFGIATLLLRAYGRRFFYTWHQHLCNTLMLLIAASCALLQQLDWQIPLLCKLVSWLYLAYSLLNILFNKTTLEQLSYNLLVLYALLCSSHELIFIHLLNCELRLTLKAKRTQNALSLALALLLYSYFSFLALTDLSTEARNVAPHLMHFYLCDNGAYNRLLAVFKILLPLLLNACTLYAHSPYQLHARHVFLWLLLMCDIMALNFLYLIRNTGSWLQVGISVTQFVMAELTTVILLALYHIAKLLLLQVEQTKRNSGK